MQTWFPVVVLLAAIGLTYLFCIRPMRRGQCDSAGRASEQTTDQREEIDRLRKEIAQARRELGIAEPDAEHRAF